MRRNNILQFSNVRCPAKLNLLTFHCLRLD